MQIFSFNPVDVYHAEPSYKTGRVRLRFVALPRAGRVLLPGPITTQFIQRLPRLAGLVASRVANRKDTDYPMFVSARLLVYTVKPATAVVERKSQLLSHRPGSIGETVGSRSLRTRTDWVERSVTQLLSLRAALFPDSQLCISCPTCYSRYEACTKWPEMFAKHDELIWLCESQEERR